MGNRQKSFLKPWRARTEITGLGEGTLHLRNDVHRLQNRIRQFEEDLKNEISQKNNAYQVINRLCRDLVGAQAKLTVQDLDYASKRGGLSGNDISIAYTGGATAGAEVVTVTGAAISVQIQTGVSDADQVKAAVDKDANAKKLVEVSVSGTGSTAQVTVGAANLADGFGALNPRYKLLLGL